MRRSWGRLSGTHQYKGSQRRFLGDTSILTSAGQYTFEWNLKKRNREMKKTWPRQPCWYNDCHIWQNDSHYLTSVWGDVMMISSCLKLCLFYHEVGPLCLIVHFRCTRNSPNSINKYFQIWKCCHRKNHNCILRIKTNKLYVCRMTNWAILRRGTHCAPCQKLLQPNKAN